MLGWVELAHAHWQERVEWLVLSFIKLENVTKVATENANLQLTPRAEPVEQKLQST